MRAAMGGNPPPGRRPQWSVSNVVELLAGMTSLLRAEDTDFRVPVRPTASLENRLRDFLLTWTTSKIGLHSESPFCVNLVSVY